MSAFLGIYREPLYSPGRHASNDAKILLLVGQALERQGMGVKLVSLEEARHLWKQSELIFSMCQGPAALSELATWKRQGAWIVNDPLASLRTYRESLCQSLPLPSVPFPRSAVLSTDGSANLVNHSPFFLAGGAWLKRADVHATQPEDVVRVEREEDLPAALELFRARGHKNAVLQENITGDEVKFYGVQGGRFFWPYYPKDCMGHPFDEALLKRYAEEAARFMGLTVYGGDAMIEPNGAITLIDVNDWPSFAPCRGAAAYAIAQHLKELYAHRDHRTAVAIA